jgi:ABC-type phosphate transport system substrate-binding protein
MRFYPRGTVLLLLATVLQLGCEAKNMAVIVPKSNTTGNIASAELAKMFTATSTKWADGRNLTLILRGGASLQDAELVVERIFKVDEAEARKLMATHVSTFVLVDSDADVLKKVESIPGAIGLVDVYSITSAVNVLKVDGKLPLEHGYLLR